MGFAEGKNGFDSHPITYDMCWWDLKQRIIDKAIRCPDKNNINGIHGCTYIPNTPNKKHESAIDRHLLCLDFDKSGCDANYIMDKLKDYVYIGWTSFSSYAPNSKGEMNKARLKFLLPLAKQVPLSDWGDDNNKDGWMAENFISVFESLGFDGLNELDKSCRVFGHIQYIPAFNRDTTYVNTNGNPQIDMWINDGRGTSRLDAYKLFPKPAPKAVGSPTAGVTAGAATTVAAASFAGAGGAVLGDTQRDALVRAACIDPAWRKSLGDILCSKPELTGLSYDSAKGVYSYKIITIGLVLLGFTYREYEPIYKHMVSGRKTNPSKDCITTYDTAVADVNGDTKKKYNWGLALKALSYADKATLNLIGRDFSPESYKAELDSDESLWTLGYGNALRPFIDVDKVCSTGHKIVYLSAPPGSGKTYGFELMDTPYDPVRVIVPSTSIRKQAGSDNKIHYDPVCTYEQAMHADARLAARTILIIDECHQLGLIGFRANALRAFAHIFSLPWKKIVFCSATHGANQWDNIVTSLGLNPVTDVYRYKFVPHIKQRVVYSVLSAEGKTEEKKGVTIIDAISARCVEAHKRGEKFLVILDSGVDLNKIKSNLSMISINSPVIVAADSSDKNTETYELATDKDYSMSVRGVDGLLSTRLSCEGINIRDIGNSATVIIGGDLQYEFVYQASGRFRNIMDIKVEHISPGNTQGEYNNVVVAMCAQRIIDRKEYIDNMGPGVASIICRDKFISKMATAFGDGSKAMQNLQRDGYTYDDGRIGSDNVLPHPLAQSIAISDIANNKFYKSTVHRKIRMSYYGCSIGSDIFLTHADIGKSLCSDALRMGRIMNRANGTNQDKGIIAALKILFAEHNPKDYFDSSGFAHVTGKHTTLVWQVIQKARLIRGITNDTIIDIASKCIMGGYGVEKIDHLLALEESPVVQKVRKQYSIGSFITTCEQNQILTDLYNHAHNGLVAMGKTDIEAKKILCGEDKMFEKLSVISVGGTWVCESKRPAETLRANGILLLGESTKARLVVAGVTARVRGAYVTAA